MHFKVLDGEVVEPAGTVDAPDLGHVLPLYSAGLLLGLELLLLDRLVRRGRNGRVAHESFEAVIRVAGS